MKEGALIFLGILAVLYGIWVGITLEKRGIAASCYEEQKFDIDGTDYYCHRSR